VTALGPATRVFGWGKDEQELVRDVSLGGGAVLPSDWSLNLSALQHLRCAIPEPPRRGRLTPRQAGERWIAFVMTDGDNLQFMGGSFVDHPGFWANTNRGRFPVTWEVPPLFAEFAPRALAHLYRTATTNDAFIAGPSGLGYYFPHHSPDRAGLAVATAAAMTAAHLSFSTVLNDDGDLQDTRELLDQPSIAGLVYKDYAPYNKLRGRTFRHRGKVAAAYRYLLWEGNPLNTPHAVTTAFEKLPSGTDAGAEAFALVNVHAWSWKSIGGPMEAIRQTVERLPAGTRVVTAPELLEALAELRIAN
jgi:hypothetical protein